MELTISKEPIVQGIKLLHISFKSYQIGQVTSGWWLGLDALGREHMVASRRRLLSGLEVAGDELWLHSESRGSCLTNSDFDPEFERVELDSGELPAAAKTENLEALSIKAISEGKIGGGGG
uniref:Uncharacterized protein n=1 Tax=Solanum lycopersicum TaxID=4081 RepID=A0A3Q7IJS0_SOLLC